MAQIVDVWPPRAEFVLALRGDAVFDARLLQIVAAQKESVGLVDLAIPPLLQPLVASAPNVLHGKFCGAALLHRNWASAQIGPFGDVLRDNLEQQNIAALDVAAQPVYSATVRRELRPFWFPAPSATNKKLAERLLLNSAQKGTLDFPAWVHAPIENFLISKLARRSITPNQLTVLSNIVAWIATILFATGHLVSGIVLALVVGVLDGLDGKQARIKVETSKSGNLEHWFDGLFEISWWVALAYHFWRSGELPHAFHYLFLLLFAEAMDAVAKGSILFTHRKLIDELGPFDRLVTFCGRTPKCLRVDSRGRHFLRRPGKGFHHNGVVGSSHCSDSHSRAAWALYRIEKIRSGLLDQRLSVSPIRFVSGRAHALG